MKKNSCKTPVIIVLVLFVLAAMASGCGGNEERGLYYRFADRSWARFNKLSFELPVEEAEVCDVYLYARFEPGFLYETLDFNMVMNTPGGEERIREYQMRVKMKSGDFCIECDNDSCQGTILLKRELNLTKPGILKIEIENLTPRMTTQGVLGVGIRLERSGK